MNCPGCLMSRVEGCPSHHVATSIEEIWRFAWRFWISDAISDASVHRIGNLFLLVRTHRNFDTLSCQNGLDCLYFVPCLQIVLGKDCVLGAPSIEWHWGLGGEHAGEACVASQTCILIFQALVIDHRVWSPPCLTMTWTLIHNTEILTHIFMFLAPNVCC